VDEIKADHDKALIFISKLLAKTDTEFLKQFIINRNLYLGGEIGGNSTRTICLLDATGSMTSCLRNAKQSVSKMFERAYDILQSAGEAASFEMQFAAYRNYNVPATALLQFSPWSSRPQELQQFLESVKPQGGMGNEAIEIAMWHVNQQHALAPIGQVLIIGDRPPNTREEVPVKRREGTWEGTQFAEPTFFDDEFQTVVQNGIKVHAFYVHSKARQAFTAMSEQTNGDCQALDVDSPEAGEELTNLVTRHILNQQGGSAKGAALVAAYDAKYGRRGHVV
jgi:hypothetical protein